MTRFRCKDTAESVLRELPSVLGVHVREDIHGHPREIHLLVAQGPDPRELAMDVRQLLEKCLGIPVDQRVISIAQLSDHGSPQALSALAARNEQDEDTAPATDETRILFAGIESLREDGRISVRVRLAHADEEFEAEGVEVDSEHGTIRAAASATLAALERACRQQLRLQLDTGSAVYDADRCFALVAVLAGAARLGRKPLLLAGIQSAEEGVESAAALAALKATNRVTGLILEDLAAASGAVSWARRD